MSYVSLWKNIDSVWIDIVFCERNDDFMMADNKKRTLIYYHTSNIRCTRGNKLVDHSDVVGAAPTRDAPTTSECSIFILDITPGFNGLGKDNWKTIWETFRFLDFVSYSRGLTISFFKRSMITEPKMILSWQMIRNDRKDIDIVLILTFPFIGHIQPLIWTLP